MLLFLISLRIFVCFSFSFYEHLFVFWNKSHTVQAGFNMYLNPALNSWSACLRAPTGLSRAAHHNLDVGMKKQWPLRSDGHWDALTTDTATRGKQGWGKLRICRCPNHIWKSKQEVSCVFFLFGHQDFVQGTSPAGPSVGGSDGRTAALPPDVIAYRCWWTESARLFLTPQQAENTFLCFHHLFYFLQREEQHCLWLQGTAWGASVFHKEDHWLWELTLMWEPCCETP